MSTGTWTERGGSCVATSLNMIVLRNGNGFEGGLKIFYPLWICSKKERQDSYKARGVTELAFCQVDNLFGRIKSGLTLLLGQHCNRLREKHARLFRFLRNRCLNLSLGLGWLSDNSGSVRSQNSPT